MLPGDPSYTYHTWHSNDYTITPHSSLARLVPYNYDLRHVDTSCISLSGFVFFPCLFGAAVIRNVHTYSVIYQQFYA